MVAVAVVLVSVALALVAVAVAVASPTPQQGGAASGMCVHRLKRRPWHTLGSPQREALPPAQWSCGGSLLMAVSNVRVVKGMVLAVS